MKDREDIKRGIRTVRRLRSLRTLASLAPPEALGLCAYCATHWRNATTAKREEIAKLVDWRATRGVLTPGSCNVCYVKKSR